MKDLTCIFLGTGLLILWLAGWLGFCWGFHYKPDPFVCVAINFPVVFGCLQIVSIPARRERRRILDEIARLRKF
jgi:hypothetical protein